MMRYIFWVLLFILLTGMLEAQYYDFLDYNPEPKSEKSATQAMLMSAIFPGAGQFYVDKKSPTAYIFPAIEITLWYLLFDYYNKGEKKEREYERYADAHYSRDRHNAASANLVELMRLSNGEQHPIFNKRFFQLDPVNGQHYYEDIGKYNKFIFGWDDWYDRYYYDNSYNWATEGQGPERNWVGNYYDGVVENPREVPHLASPNREVYIAMREKAEDYYRVSRNMRFGLLANHAVATFDAMRVAKKYNRSLSSQQYGDIGSRNMKQASNFSIKPHLGTTVVHNDLVPMFSLTIDFK